MADVRRFDPNQKRDPNGEWGDGIPGSSAVKDALKLAGRIDLGPGETFAGSDTVDANEGRINLARIDRNGQQFLRLGVVADEDTHRWRAADKGGTVELDQDAVDTFRGELARMADKAKLAVAELKQLNKDYDKFYAKHGEHPTGRADSERWLADLPPGAAAEYQDLNDRGDELLDQPVATGGLYATWGDLRYELQLHDDASWYLVLGVRPKGAPDDWELRSGAESWLSPAQLRQLSKKLDPGTATRSSSDPKEALVFERYNDQHAPAGSANGGQFAAGGGGGGGKPAKSAKTAHRPGHSSTPAQPARKPDDGTLSYDPGSNQGTGYNSKTGDPRVHALQQALTRLGIKDSSGKVLKDDGRLGPRTTSAVKALQQRLGLKPDGKVTPSLLAQIKSMKSLPAKRSVAVDMCIRAFGFEFEERSRNTDGRTLEGYAAVFNSPTRIAAVGGDFDEVISPGAFTRSLRSRMPVLQFEHGRDPRVGAVPIGSIDDLSEDSQGLHVRATLFDNPVVDPVRQAIAGRAIKGMSFRFNVASGGDAWQRRSGDVDLRTVGDADVHELGPVVFPAYDSTTVSVRSLLAQLGPEEHLTLLRELAHDLRAVDLQDLTGRADARSAAGGDFDAEQPGERQASTTSLETRFAADGDSLRLRGIL